MNCWICMEQTGSDDHFCKRHMQHFGSDGSKKKARANFTDRQIRLAYKRQHKRCDKCDKPSIRVIWFWDSDFQE